MYRFQLILFICLVLVAVNNASASGRSGLVYQSGEVRWINGGASRLTGTHPEACDEDRDLVFRFTESASPDALRLEFGVQDQGQIQVDVRIDLTCQTGSVTFEYFHQRGPSFPETGADVTPDQPVITLPLQAGATASTTVSYGVLSPRVRSARVELVGERITFIAGDVFGQTNETRTLASIRFLGQVLDEVVLDESDVVRVRDAGRALNEACRQADADSDFGETCAEIRENAVTSDQQLMAARAFDGHELAATVQASGEGGRIQTANVRDRLVQLHTGGPALSASGLSLSIDGQRIDSSWLPVSVRMAEREPESRLMTDRWGMFVNGNIAIGRRSERNKEVDFDFDSWGLTLGTDYRTRNGAVAGFALGYSRYDADIGEQGGSLDGDTYTVQLFGSVNFTPDFYADLTAGYSRTDFEQERIVDLSGIGTLTRQAATGSTSSEQYSGSLSLNYRRAFDNGVSITPYAQLHVAEVTIDGFSETGSVFALEYPEQSYTSELWSGGLRLTRAFSRKRAIFSPFADLSLQHQSGFDGYGLQPRLVGTDIAGPMVDISDPDRTFGRFDTGAVWLFPTGTQAFFSYSAMLFERHTTQHSFQIGGRWEF